MRKLSPEFIEEINKIIGYEVARFWNNKGKHIRGIAFGYHIDQEDIKQEIWLRLIEFINKKFPDMGSEELLKNYKGLLWHKVKLLLTDTMRAWGYHRKKETSIYKMARAGADIEEIGEKLNVREDTILKVLSFRMGYMEDMGVPTDRQEHLKDENSPEDAYIEKEALDKLKEALSNGLLSSQEKQVLKLFLQGYRKIDIARWLGKSPPWVSYMFSTAVQKIREKYFSLNANNGTCYTQKGKSE